MLAKRFLITVWLCLLAASALPAQNADHAAAPTAQEGQHPLEHAAKGTMEMSTSDFFKSLFGHSVPSTTCNRGSGSASD